MESLRWRACHGFCYTSPSGLLFLDFLDLPFCSPFVGATGPCSSGVVALPQGSSGNPGPRAPMPPHPESQAPVLQAPGLTHNLRTGPSLLLQGSSLPPHRSLLQQLKVLEDLVILEAAEMTSSRGSWERFCWKELCPFIPPKISSAPDGGVGLPTKVNMLCFSEDAPAN